MRLPIDVTIQKRCPVCNKSGPGTRPPITPRLETASLSLLVMSEASGQSRAACLRSELLLGWDSGVSKGRRSRTSLGASLLVAKREGQDPDWGDGLSVEFCSTACLRRFLNDAVDALERRADAMQPKVKAARAKSEASG